MGALVTPTPWRAISSAEGSSRGRAGAGRPTGAGRAVGASPSGRTRGAKGSSVRATSGARGGSTRASVVAPGVRVGSGSGASSSTGAGASVGAEASVMSTAAGVGAAATGTGAAAGAAAPVAVEARLSRARFSTTMRSAASSAADRASGSVKVPSRVKVTAWPAMTLRGRGDTPLTAARPEATTSSASTSWTSTTPAPDRSWTLAAPWVTVTPGPSSPARIQRAPLWRVTRGPVRGAVTTSSSASRWRSSTAGAGLSSTSSETPSSLAISGASLPSRSPPGRLPGDHVASSPCPRRAR